MYVIVYLFREVWDEEHVAEMKVLELLELLGNLELPVDLELLEVQEVPAGELAESEESE